MAVIIGNLGPFDERSEKFSDYADRFEAYVAANALSRGLGKSPEIESLRDLETESDFFVNAVMVTFTSLRPAPAVCPGRMA